jgi:phosphoglucomutase
MDIRSVPIRPFSDQRPGTSGLRKKAAVFSRTGYVEAFAQSIFDALPEAEAALAPLAAAFAEIEAMVGRPNPAS